MSTSQPAAQAPDGPDGLQAALATLRSERGLDARMLDRLVARLAAGDSLAGLIRHSAVPRRDVEDVVRRLEPWISAEGDRLRLAAGGDLPLAR